MPFQTISLPDAMMFLAMADCTPGPSVWKGAIQVNPCTTPYGVGATSIPPPGLDLAAVLHALAEKGITRLLVEGGARVASSFVAANLADEVWLLRGAHPVGADGVPALEALPLSAITRSPAFKLRASETLQGDTLTIYERI